MLELSELDKLSVDQRTLLLALYGHMQVAFFATSGGEKFETTLSHLGRKTISVLP